MPASLDPGRTRAHRPSRVDVTLNGGTKLRTDRRVRSVPPKSGLGLLIGIVGVGAIVGSDFGSGDATAFVQIAVVVVGYAVGPAILARRLGGLPAVMPSPSVIGRC